jgi:hypothetical protein
MAVQDWRILASAACSQGEGQVAHMPSSGPGGLWLKGAACVLSFATLRQHTAVPAS